MNLKLQLKMCLNEKYSRVQVGKNLMFPVRNGLKLDALLPCSSSVLYSMPLGGFR